MEEMTGGVAGTDDLCRLIYVSRNLLEGPAEAVEQEVFRILEVSRRNNLRDGITGALLFSTDYFAQALEGPPAAVHRAFERIQCDARHSGTVVLSCGNVPAREFGEWSMAYVGRVQAEGTRYATLAMPQAAEHESRRVLNMLHGVVERSSTA